MGMPGQVARIHSSIMGFTADTYSSIVDRLNRPSNDVPLGFGLVVVGPLLGSVVEVDGAALGSALSKPPSSSAGTMQPTRNSANTTTAVVRAKGRAALRVGCTGDGI